MSETVDHFSLQGRTALVTGAVGLIGRAICREFAAGGARLVVTDVSQESCLALADELHREFGVATHAAAFDITDGKAVDDHARTISDEFGVCDAVIVNAGILALAPVLEMESTTWERVMSVNLTGAFHTAKSFAAEMVRTNTPGTMVFSSSLFGIRGGAGNSAYSASKFGIIGLAQSMAADLARHNIRVNSVCPGQIDSTMMDNLFETRATQHGTTAPAEKNQFLTRIPLGSLGTVDEVARTYRYLSTPASAYVTGQHIIVDGGWQVG